MDFDNIIRSRRSCRNFKSKKISYQNILDIVEAGIWAPSSGGSAPWKFKIVDSCESIDRLYSLIADVNYQKKRVNRSNISEKELRDRFETYISGIRTAPVHIICYYDEQHMIDLFHGGNAKDYQDDRIYAPSYTNAIDLAIENMMLKATELGLGSLYLVTGVLDPKKLNKLFNLPNTLIPITIIPLGYPKFIESGEFRSVEDFLIQ
ncbi:nitroreductase family protein [Candidatus Lokiarchaeum ossiferum]|uniref:nitroreductase family protein n=1 Tax=Candidatus Lokiarchaeum ossiferum TaxID=2951803 RepID=UPI00352D067D